VTKTPPNPAEMAAYEAVWNSGWLTPSAEMNAHIWRSVTAALEAYKAATP
jgi:hypothetical protein